MFSSLVDIAETYTHTLKLSYFLYLKVPQEVCEAQEITASGTTITSPGYNGNSGSYPNLASCNWTVVAAHNQVDPCFSFLNTLI